KGPSLSSSRTRKLGEGPFADTGALRRLVGRNVPRHLAAFLAGTVFLLLEVVHLELPEVESDLLGEPIFAPAGTGADRRDHHVLQLYLVIFQRLIAGLADVQLDFGEMRAFATGEHQRRGRLVHELGETHILDADLAGAGAVAAVGSAVLRHRPTPGQHLD